MSATSYLLQYLPGGRTMIDTRHRHGFVIDGRTIAASWLDAKKQFGYPLTPLQEEILKKRKQSATAGAVTCEQLRPDVTWQRDSAGQVTGYVVTVAPAEAKAA